MHYLFVLVGKLQQFISLSVTHVLTLFAVSACLCPNFLQYKQMKYIVVENGLGLNYFVKFLSPEMTVICVVDNITVLPSLCFHKWIFLPDVMFSKQIHEAALVIALLT